MAAAYKLSQQQRTQLECRVVRSHWRLECRSINANGFQERDADDRRKPEEVCENRHVYAVIRKRTCKHQLHQIIVYAHTHHVNIFLPLN